MFMKRIAIVGATGLVREDYFAGVRGGEFA